MTALKNWIRNGRDAWKNVKTKQQVYIVNLKKQEGGLNWGLVAIFKKDLFEMLGM